MCENFVEISRERKKDCVNTQKWQGLQIESSVNISAGHNEFPMFIVLTL
jgi:hypothetical protein